MAIQNINTIQNHKDLAYILDNSNKYMYESLSNLGQRYSLKGDGITSENFNIKSLLTNYTLNNDKTYIVKLSVNNNKLWIYLYDIEINNSITKFNEVYKKEIKYTVNNVLNTDSKIQLNQKINGIDYYQENMLIYLDDLNSQNQKLNIASIGLDDNNGIIEMNIESYNINDNTLLESLKLIDLNTDTYQLYYLTYDDESNYILYNYSIEKTSINNLYTDFSYFVTYIYNNIVKEYYSEYNKLVISDIFNEIIQTGFKNNINGNTSGIEVKYNDNSEYVGFYSEDADLTTNNILHYIYNQYIYMYRYIFEYYCNYIYKADNNQLNSHILYKLYETVVNTANPESYNGYDIYLPIDFNIDYYCKDTDKFYIYSNLSPIPVLYTLNNLSNDYVYEFFNSITNNKLNNNIILAHSNIIENIILYNVSVEYNEDFENIINNIYFKELYSTPYIEDGYWVVNGIKTTYSAKGKDAGNPNIIIVYTNNISTDNNNNNIDTVKYNGYTEKDYSILSSINYKDINSVIFDKKTASIELQKVNNTTLTVLCNFLVPTEIPDDFKHIFDNALIINLSSVYNIVKTDNTVKNDIIKYLGPESFITTFWTYSNETNEFICIQKPNTNNALTLLDISNTESIIASLVEKTVKSQEYYNNEFDSIVLKATYTTTKNEIATGSTFDSNTFRITLKNYVANEQVVNQTIPNLENYNNNLMLKFNISNTNKNKYFNDYILKDTIVNYFNESYIYNISDYNEYASVLPAANVPIFNFADYFTVNINNLNRINLITLPYNSENINTRPYYSYIGIGNDKPNELHIGSSNRPLSLYQLVDNIDSDFTNTQDTISFDFDKIKTQAKEITQNFSVDENNTVYTYTINVSIPCYDNINNYNSYLLINTSEWKLSHEGKYNNIHKIKPVIFTATSNQTDTSENKMSNYVTNSFQNIYDTYIQQYTNVDIDRIDMTNTIFTENINKIIYLGNNEEYDKNKLKRWYYVFPYNPITYCVDLIIKLRFEGNVIKHIDIHCNDGKLVPFELKENGNVNT